MFTQDHPVTSTSTLGSCTEDLKNISGTDSSSIVYTERPLESRGFLSSSGSLLDAGVWDSMTMQPMTISTSLTEMDDISQIKIFE